MGKRIVLFLMPLLIVLMDVNAQEVAPEPTQDPNVPYRLFKTSNIWTFIELETSTGKMWIIQYSLKDSERGGFVLNNRNLAENKKKIDGRFTLYPTSNIWTFILLDQISGSTWQVQWSFDEDKRFVIPLY